MAAASMDADSAAISVVLGALFDRAAPECVLLYEPSGIEPNVSPLRKQQPSAERFFYLPRMDWAGNLFHAALARPGEPLVSGRFGLLEPPSVAPVIAPDHLDAIVIPGVAFDEAGARLGRGGGHYDRFLAAAGDAPLRIGVCFDEFLLGSDQASRLGLPDRVPTEPHDQLMHAVVTPTRTIRLRNA